MSIQQSSFPTTPTGLTRLGDGYLPGLLGIEILESAAGRVRARLPIRRELLAPNGYLHAGSVVTFADTLCGYGCRLSVPEGASGFTTIELKSNFLGTVREGAVMSTATLVHGGRMTQVWDAEVVDEATSKPIAHFRCTQMILYPRD
jgi:uncharacterized protein (TIGR00369 family)